MPSPINNPLLAKFLTRTSSVGVTIADGVKAAGSMGWLGKTVFGGGILGAIFGLDMVTALVRNDNRGIITLAIDALFGGPSEADARSQQDKLMEAQAAIEDQVREQELKRLRSEDARRTRIEDTALEQDRQAAITQQQLATDQLLSSRRAGVATAADTLLQSAMQKAAFANQNIMAARSEIDRRSVGGESLNPALLSGVSIYG